MENDTNEIRSKRPSHVAWWVKEREGKNPEWRQIGIAWTHADEKGINISLDCMPIDGRIVLRLIEPKGVR